jgi:hypothetical protein
MFLHLFNQYCCQNLPPTQNKPKTGMKMQHTEQIANQWLILSQRLQNEQWDTNQERYFCQI